MKLDNGHIVSPGSVGHNADTKPAEYANTAFNSTTLKNPKDNDKENHNGLRSDFKGTEIDSDRLEYQVDNVVGGWTEFDGSEKAVREYVGAMSPSHHYVKPRLFEDSVFYLDKSVMEGELPEVVVFKENTYQVVKDICVDTGGDPKSLCVILPPGKETTGQIIRGNEDPDGPIPDAFKSPVEQTDLRHCPPDEMGSSQENDSQSDPSISSNHKASRPGDGGDDTNEMDGKVLPKDNRLLRDLLSMTHWGTELSWPGSCSDRAEESKLQSIQKAGEDSPPEMDSAHSKPQSDNEEATPGESRLLSAAEGSDHAIGGETLEVPLVNSGVSPPDHTGEQLETAALASELNERDDPVKEASHPNELTGSDALELDSTAPGSNCEESCPKKTDEEHLEPQNASGLQLDGPDTSSSHTHYSQGETSFSNAVPFSGLITYTGPIAYSGSLSLRSDSSTTSTRSFAFPILQSEWNNSPVRMAKADRKHLGWHRRWRHGLLCCKF